MTIKFHTFDLWKDNEKHLYFVAEVDQATNNKQNKMADVIYVETGSMLDIDHLTTHEFPNIQALVNFLNGNTLHFDKEQIENINKELGLDIWQ